MPEGVFSLLDSDTEVGIALVKHPLVKAVGFAGSRNAGRALLDMAAARPEPIPVFAEMSSTNPVFIFVRYAKTATALQPECTYLSRWEQANFPRNLESYSCRKPTNSETFINRLQELVLGSGQFHMLTAGIPRAYQSATTRRKTEKGVKQLAATPSSTNGQKKGADAALFETDVQSFLENPNWLQRSSVRQHL